MSMRALSLRVLCGSAAVVLACAGGAQAQIAELTKQGINLSVDTKDVAVSGISSGAAMAHQLHIAYSASLTGVGMVAGPPYRCAQMLLGQPEWALASQVDVAVALCTAAYKDFPMATPIQLMVADLAVDPARLNELLTESLKRGGSVADPEAGLCGDRVYLISGSEDTMVPGKVTEGTRDVYTGIKERCKAQGAPGVTLRAELRGGMPHTMPTDSKAEPGKCPAGPPYIADCDWPGGSKLLAFLHPGKATPAEASKSAPADANQAAPADAVKTASADAVKAVAGAAKPENLIAFNQRKVIGATEPQGSMHEVGHIYVPDQCKKGESCALHVAIHGCKQNDDMIGDGASFSRDAGYNDWAERHGVIVLYPQVAASPAGGNPNGCWDWWGYSGVDYYQKGGRQMRNLWALVQAVIKG